MSKHPAVIDEFDQEIKWNENETAISYLERGISHETDLLVNIYSLNLSKKTSSLL